MRNLKVGNAGLFSEHKPSGLAPTSWWRVDPTTGTKLGMTTNNRGDIAVEYMFTLIEHSIKPISVLSKFVDYEQCKDVPTRTCCLIEANISNIGGLITSFGCYDPLSY